MEFWRDGRSGEVRRDGAQVEVRLRGEILLGGRRLGLVARACVCDEERDG